MPDWRGAPAVVIAAGPTASREQAEEALRLGCKIVAVNRSYELAPFADIVYAADKAFWCVYEDAQEHSGLKVCSHNLVTSFGSKDKFKHKTAQDCIRFANDADIRPVCVSGADFNFEGEPIGHGGHGGFQAVNLTILTGANPILGIGFDYFGGHWHKEHKDPLYGGVRELGAWRKNLDRQHPLMKRHGIRFVVCGSPKSPLQNYPKAMTVREGMKACNGV